ncbi:hypothetical protein XANCAGTX0491_010033 [Xanthoria calcicola]
MDLPLSCNPAGATEDGRCAVSLVSRLSTTNPTLISYQIFLPSKLSSSSLPRSRDIGFDSHSFGLVSFSMSCL